MQKEIDADFRIFGLNSDATLDDLKRRYRKLCLLYHPDKEEGSSQKFIELTEAYQRLQNVLKSKTSDTTKEEKPSSFEQLYETLFDALQRYIVSLLKEKIKPKTITITIRPRLEDIYSGQVTKVMVKVLREQPERHLKSIPLYISFIPFKRSYLFIGVGDEISGVRGDVEVLIEVDVITDGSLCHEVWLNANEFIFGFEKSIELVDGVSINIKRCSFLVDPETKQRLPNMGLLLDEDGNRGDLLLKYKLKPLSEEEAGCILKDEHFREKFLHL